MLTFTDPTEHHESVAGAAGHTPSLTGFNFTFPSIANPSHA